MWDYPDLCVIHLDEVPDEHPWAVLGDFSDIDDLDVYLSAYGATYAPELMLEGKTARLGGPVYMTGGRLWQFTGVELSPGNAGGPMLDLRSGSVCAVAKTARRADAAMGGLAIPVSAIKEAFPDVWRRNQSEPNRQWQTAQSGSSATAGYAGTPGAPASSAGSAISPQEPASPQPEPSTSSLLAGGVSSDLVNPACGIPIERDRLDVGVWVSMLAAAITSGDTQMPLSIGIFGEWGAGKSYFMGLLRSEIERLSRSNREACLGRIVQIGFNAWHYADSNLWASLGDEIFRQLAGSAGAAAGLRQDLRDKIAAGSAERTALQARVDHAAAEAERLQAEVDEAMSRLRHRARDLLHALMKSAAFQAQMRKVWQRLGIRDEMQQAALLAGEVRGAAQDAATIRGLLAQQRPWLLAAACTLAVSAFAAAAWAPANAGRWLSGGGAAAVALGLGAALTWVTKARSGLAQLRAIVAEVNENMSSAASDQIPSALGDTIASLRRAEADEQITQRQLDEAVARVGQLTRELMDLQPSQRMYAFLAGLNQSETYAGSLSLISTIRKDFEHLVALLNDWRTEGADDPDQRPVDRIVLYIDDLDRCSPQQVVSVLQAVHLLLALDLFVVVVGVDPRWLHRSLERQYEKIFPESDVAGEAGQVVSEVTPTDYLEKIFNLPFVLPGMPPEGLGRMLRALAVTVEPGTPSGTPEDRTRSGASPRQEQSGPAAARPSKTPSRPATEPPRPLTEPELQILSGMQIFIRTPRDAKRMLNLYRMLRSSPDLSQAGSFLGDDSHPGDYQAVAMLLAMQTSDSQLLDEVINARPDPKIAAAGGLLHRPITDDWFRFTHDLTPAQSNGTWENKIIGPIPHRMVPAWQQFAASSAETSKLITLPDLAPFRRWAQYVQRFSFTLPASVTIPPRLPDIE